jgi:hypothetical protein
VADLAILPSLLPSQHLADPAGAITQMTGAKSSTPIAMHCIAIIGVCHAVLGFLYAMFAKVKSEGVRKCSLAIWGAVFLPLCTYAQYAFPATGKAPVGIPPMDMPFPPPLRLRLGGRPRLRAHQALQVQEGGQEVLSAPKTPSTATRKSSRARKTK